jgi:Domain of unknown function (DUF4440)
MRALTLMGIAVGSLIGGLGLLVAADEARAETQVEQELLQLEQEWANALVRSDTTKLGHIMAEGWEAIIPSGEVWTKETFLMLLKTGALAIESAENADVKVRVYGDAAVVTGQQSSPRHPGSSSLLVMQGGEVTEAPGSWSGIEG